MKYALGGMLWTSMVTHSLETSWTRPEKPTASTVRGLGKHLAGAYPPMGFYPLPPLPLISGYALGAYPPIDVHIHHPPIHHV